MNIFALCLSFIVGLFILIGYLLAIKFKENKRFTDFSISLAFGVIISLGMLEILPHTYHIFIQKYSLSKTILIIVILALIGIFILKILDLFIPHHIHEEHHLHEHKTDDCHKKHLAHIGLVSASTIIIHNIIEGMSLYLVSSTSVMSGLFMCIGIGLHNIPMGLMIATTLYNSNFSKKKVLIVILSLILSTFIGGLVMFVLGNIPTIIEGILLGITLGMLIYISIFELLHQIYHMKKNNIVRIGVFIGIFILVISVLLGHVLGHTH